MRYIHTQQEHCEDADYIIHIIGMIIIIPISKQTLQRSVSSRWPGELPAPQEVYVEVVDRL